LDFKNKNVIIFDTLLEYGDLNNFSIVNNSISFKELVNNFISEKRKIKIIIQPLGEEGYLEEAFEKICYYVKIIGNVIFVIEETDLYCSPYYISENLRYIIEYGRHRNIGIIASARRFTALSRYLTSQAHKIITFRQTEPRDLKLLSEFDFDPDIVSKLKDYEFIEKEI